MGEIDLSPEQLKFALRLSGCLKHSGYALMTYDEFGQSFGYSDSDALKFILSTNSWKMKLDTVLELVVVTYDGNKKPSWPIEELSKQVSSMNRRGVQSEDRKK